MKTLTVRQPWAGLIVAGIKNVENRTWHTQYSGPLAIHASAKVDNQAVEAMREKLGDKYPAELCAVTGAVLGTVELTALVWVADDGEVETDHPTIEAEELKEWWEPECIGFILENPQAFPQPIQAKGALGLWNWSKP